MIEQTFKLSPCGTEYEGQHNQGWMSLCSIDLAFRFPKIGPMDGPLSKEITVRVYKDHPKDLAVHATRVEIRINDVFRPSLIRLKFSDGMFDDELLGTMTAGVVKRILNITNGQILWISVEPK